MEYKDIEKDCIISIKFGCVNIYHIPTQLSVICRSGPRISEALIMAKEEIIKKIERGE